MSPSKPEKTPRTTTKNAQLRVEQLESRDLMSAGPLDPTIMRLQSVLLGAQHVTPDAVIDEARASETELRDGVMTVQLDIAARQESLTAAQASYASTLDSLTAARAPERELERLSSALASAEAETADLPDVRAQVDVLRQTIAGLETDEQKSTLAIQTLQTQKAAIDAELAQINASISAMEAELAKPREKAGVIRSLTGHADSILSTALSPDGKTGASAGSGGTVKIWDVETGKELWQIKYGTAAVADIAFSSDGKTLITGGADMSVRLFDMATKQEIRKMTGLSFSSVAMSPNRTMVAAGTTSQTVTVWDAATGKTLRTFAGLGSHVRDIQFSPNGSYLTVASDDSIRMLNLQTGATLTLARLRGVLMNGTAFSPDGNTIATAGSDKIVHLWDMTGKEIRRFTGHAASVTKLEFSADGTELYSTGNDGTVRVWNVSTGAQKKMFTTAAGEYVAGLDSIADGRMLVAGSSRTVRYVRANDEPLPPGVSQQALDGLKTQRTQKTAQQTDTANAIAAEQAKNQDLDTQIATQKTTLGTRQEELNAKESVAAGIPSLRTQVSDAQAQADAAQPTVVQLTHDLSVTQATITLVQNDIDTMFAKLAEKQRQLANASNIKEALTNAKNAQATGAASRTLSAFEQGVVQSQVSSIMGDLLPLGGQTMEGALEAMATGMTQEEFEAATWDMFADALGSATGADIDGIGELNDVLGRQADREWMEADIWNGVAERIENLLFAESLSSETVTMSGTAAGDSNQLRLALALQNLGGSMSINSVNGALPLATNLSVASGTEAARLLGQLDPDAPAPAAIAPLSNLSFDSEGWPVSIGSTFTVPGLGSVLAHANNGQPWNIQNQGSDVRYLTYKNGTLASTTSREWWQSTTDFGTVLIRFQSGPQYVAAINVQRINAAGNARLKLTDADGNVSYVPLDGSGSVKIDKILREFTLENRDATYGIESIDSRELVPDADWEGMASVTKVDGSGTWLDFAQAGKLVTEASGRIESTNPDDRITAHVYRGSTKVETIELGAGGVWSVDNEQGFSSIVFNHVNAGSTLFMGDLNVGTDGSANNASWEAATPANNRDVSLSAARKWENSTTYKDVDGMNIFQPYGGQELVVTGQMRMEVGNDYPGEYQRLEFHGSPQFHRLLYVNESGLHEVPSSHYTVIAGNVILVHPGAPRRLVTEIWGDGTITAPNFAKHGMEMNDVMPPFAPELKSDWIMWGLQPRGEGWTDIPSGVVNESLKMVPGSTVNGLWEIRNDGIEDSDVTVHFRVGQTGTTADPIQKSFTGHIGGMSRYGLSANVTVIQERDVISVEVVLPNGTSFIHGKRTQTPLGPQREAETQPDGTVVWKDVYTLPDRDSQISHARLIVRIASKTTNPKMQIAAQAALEVLLSSTPETQRVAYERMTGVPYAIEDKQEMTRLITTDLFTEGERIMLESTGMGENWNLLATADTTIHKPTAAPDEMTRAYNNSQNWYTGAPFQNGVEMDTAVGRIFNGLLQKTKEFIQLQQWDALISIYDQASQITGIPTGSFRFHLLGGNKTDEQRIEGLKSLFIAWGYGHIFTAASVSGHSEMNTQETNQIVTLKTNKVHYEVRDNFVRVDFDFSANKAYHHSNIYLVVNGQVLPTPLTANDIVGETYVDIPLSKIRSLLPATVNEVPAQSWIVQLRLQAQQQANPDIFMPARQTSNLEIDAPKWGEYSTLPEGDPNRLVENQILDRISKNFPVDVSRGWYNLLGSYAHHDESMHAADLNFGDVGDDKDAPIFSVDDGKVSRLYFTGEDETNGVSILVITHTLPDQKTWDSVYMHMPMRKREDGSYDMIDSAGNIITTLKVGDTVTARQKIAATGKQGAGGDHVHFQSHIGEWTSGSAINLDRLFQSLSNPISTKAFVPSAANNVLVNFNSEIQEWVYSAEKIIVDIATVNGSGVLQYLAFEEGKTRDQMEKLEWKKATFVDDEGNLVQKETWVKLSDVSMRWSCVQKKFVPLLPQ